MIETHQIIVLNTVKYSEDKIIVNALSRDSGRVSLLVRVVHSQKSAVRHTLFQPLSILEVEWEASPRTTLFKPKSARPAIQTLSILCDPAKSAIAMFLSEFLGHVTRNEFDGGMVFEYIVYALQWLDVSESDYANFHIVFLLKLARFVGIDPNTDLPSEPSHMLYFNLQEGEYCATRPDHTYYINAREADILRTLLRLNFGTMHLFKMSGAERSRILSLIVTYYRLHLPGIPELKSLEVLRTMFL